MASWFGFQDETDFDTRLYRCLAVFRPLGMEMYKNLSLNGALPLYFLYMIVQLIFLFLTLVRKCCLKDKVEDEDGKLGKFMSKLIHEYEFTVKLDENPAKVYHIGEISIFWYIFVKLTFEIQISGVSAIFAVLGMLMARMIVFWSPYIMVFTSVAICDSNFWTLIVNKLSQSRSNNGYLVTFLRHLVLIFALVTLYVSHKESIQNLLEDLREFWDPDTVDLMQWINGNTAKNAAFAGTMQLLAGK